MQILKSEERETNKMQLVQCLISNFYLNMFRKSHSAPAYDPAPHNHNKWRTPYAIVHGLVLLMMGIMMPETC